MTVRIFPWVNFYGFVYLFTSYMRRELFLAKFMLLKYQPHMRKPVSYNLFIGKQ